MGASASANMGGWYGGGSAAMGGAMLVIHISPEQNIIGEKNGGV